MKSMLFVILTTWIFSTANKNELVGRWESKPSPKGNTTLVVFKEDASFEGFINKKPFVSGNYTYQDGLLSFTDNGCEGRRGDYKIIFFSHADSIRFVPVNDSCEERKQGMSKTILGRVK